MRFLRSTLFLGKILCNSRFTFDTSEYEACTPQDYENSIFEKSCYPCITPQKPPKALIVCEGCTMSGEIEQSISIYKQLQDFFESKINIQMIFTGVAEKAIPYILRNCFKPCEYRETISEISQSVEIAGLMFFCASKIITAEDIHSLQSKYDFVIGVNLSCRREISERTNILMVDSHFKGPELFISDFIRIMPMATYSESNGFQQFLHSYIAFRTMQYGLDPSYYEVAGKLLPDTSKYLHKLASLPFYYCDLECSNIREFILTLVAATIKICELKAATEGFKKDIYVKMILNNSSIDLARIHGYITYLLEDLQEPLRALFFKIRMTGFDKYGENLTILFSGSLDVTLVLVKCNHLDIAVKDFLLLKSQRLVVTDKDMTLSKAISSGRLVFYETVKERENFIRGLAHSSISSPKDTESSSMIFYRVKGEEDAKPSDRITADFLDRYKEWCGTKRLKGNRWQDLLYIWLQRIAIHREPCILQGGNKNNYKNLKRRYSAMHEDE
ncbi:hypothetical protein ENBRE01_1417 [Enteropsectra breve]|nr:hypothetical protein ENBRE01_1417 [Enteropsectra breve]